MPIRHKCIYFAVWHGLLPGMMLVGGETLMNNFHRVTFAITYYIDLLKVKMYVSSFVWKTWQAKLIYIYICAPRLQGVANFACMATLTG